MLTNINCEANRRSSSLTATTLYGKSQSFVEYKLYSKRWLILVLFGFAQFCTTFVYPAFTSISIHAINIYKQDAAIISLSATLYLFMHPIFTFPASYLIIQKGPAFSVKLGIFLTLLGAVVRCLAIDYEFYWVLIGQTLLGIGRPFILNSQANITSNWFPINQRTQIISIFNCLVTMSSIFGNIVPSVFFIGYQDELYTDDFTVGRGKVQNLLFFEGGLCILLLIPSTILLESNPPTPPSEYGNQPERVKFFQSIRQIFMDNKFIVLLISFSLFNGTFKGFGVVLPYLIKPFGYTSSDIIYFASAPLFGGLLSTLFATRIQKLFGSFKPFILILQIFNVGVFALFYFTCYLQNFILICSATVLIGVFITPTIPFLIEWSCQQTYPINNSFSVGLMYSGATLFSAVIGEILSVITGGKNSTKLQSFYGISVICLLYFISFLFILFLKPLNKKKDVKLSFQSDRVFIHQSIRSHTESLSFPQAHPDGLILFDIMSDQVEEGLLLGKETEDFINN